MADEVKLPRLGQGMESGTIVKWLKGEGDRVEKGEPLYELDTDKVTQEVEAEASGVLLKIAIPEGEVPVGRTIAVIGEEGEEVPEVEETPAPEAEPEREPVSEAPEQKEETAAAPAPHRDGGRVKASPLARRIARERGIELASLRGTGPEGRIVAEDVERAAASGGAATAARWAAPAPSGEVEVVKLNQMRKTIARRMTEAWEAPAFQISMSADMTASVRLREALLARMEEGGVRPTYSDILTKVVAVALMRHRDVNAHFAGDSVKIFPTANIGIAVAIPHGLVVPVIAGCERLSIPEIAAARADIVSRTRGGKLR